MTDVTPGPGGADDPFGPPPGTGWRRVSPRLRTMRRTVLALTGGPAVALAALLVGVLGGGALGVGLALGLGAALLAAGWVSVGRNWRSWGYAERADDLLVVHGAAFTTLVVVPYGRMQLVDVEAGPLARAFGLVTVKLHTAAATTDARVRGLLPAEALALRERLTALGEAHAAGL